MSLGLNALGSLSVLISSIGPRSVDPPPPPPGGYYAVGEVPETAPPDGEKAIITGSILFPLGTIRLALGFMQVELAKPEHCQYTADSCRGLTTYGWIGVSYGAISAVTGLAFLGIGLARKNHLRRWKAARNLSLDFTPVLMRDRAGAQLLVRF
jgi:hypothetical protein